jgi:hypothetical protein
MKHVARIFAVCVVLALTAARGFAQQTPTVEIFGGYSNLQANYNGWNANVTVNPTRWLGVFVDGSGYYTTSTLRIGVAPITASTSINATAYAALFGPEISLRKSRVHLFARGLVGPVHVTGAVPSFHVTAAQTETGYGGGLGFDVVLHRLIAVRLLQADYLRTNFAGRAQDLGRLSAGVVLRVGNH